MTISASPELSIVRHRDTCPHKVRVERRHRSGDARRLGSQILLVHIAIRADDERHDATRSEHCWPRDQCEPAGHAARLDVLPGSAIPVGTLRLEDAEIVALVRYRLAADELTRV